MSNSKLRNEIQRLIAAFRHSLDGLHVGFTQAAFRTELLAIFIMTPVAFYLARSGVELALLLGSLWLVLIVEMLNTAVEKAIDRISLEKHDLSKQAKDVGSTAVLMSIGCAVTIWLAILGYR